MRFFLLFLLFVLPAHAYDLPYVGEQKDIRAKYEDTFVYLARDYNLGYVEMVAANPGIDPWLPGEGAEIIIPTRHLLPDAPRDGIVINLAEMRLYAFVNGEKPPATFPLGVGRDGLETPEGTTEITRKVKGPVWFPTARMREEDPDLPQSIGPGPDNPLGTHALYLGWPQYLIHGTNKPFGIGRRVSSGCIRMYPEGIAALYDIIPVGTSVTVVDQPIKVAWIDGALYLEAHPTKEQTLQLEDDGEIKPADLSEAQKEMILSAAGDQADDLDWDLINSVVLKRSGYPVQVLKAEVEPEAVVAEDSAVSTEALPQEEVPAQEVEIQAQIEDVPAQAESVEPEAAALQDINAEPDLIKADEEVIKDVMGPVRRPIIGPMPPKMDMSKVVRRSKKLSLND